MRDGLTKKLKSNKTLRSVEDFLNAFQAKLVILSGGTAGAEVSLDRAQITLGRGPGVDLAFDDPAMSRQHAVIEYAGGGFRVRDLGSTNGIQVNDEPVQAAELGHGDRVTIGSRIFQMLIEAREQEPATYELSTEA